MTRFRVGHCAQLVAVQKCIQTLQPCGAARLKNLQAVGILLSRPDPGVDPPAPVSAQLASKHVMWLGLDPSILLVVVGET
jgi:hypothetical protein